MLETASGVVGQLHLRRDASAPMMPLERDLLRELAVDVSAGLDRLRERRLRQHLEAQLTASQRLEAVGRLAGGIAHDFNNLLSVVSIYGTFALEQLDERDPLYADIEQVVDAGRQAAELTGQLLAVGRSQVLEPRVLDLNQVLGGMNRMLRRVVGDDIDYAFHGGLHLGTVKADVSQIQRVLMNLVVNARDALMETRGHGQPDGQPDGQSDGGRIVVETRNVTLDERYAERRLSVEPGRYVQITVSDNGNGIPAELGDRIFEPFFTTKAPGKGTGLGLSTVYGIVKQSDGHILVYSEPGKGTVFKIFLPRVKDEAEEIEAEVVPTDLSGDETILLVEDLPMVRDATERALNAAGYVVLTARHGAEALAMCEQHPGRIDLLLTDLVMPEMSGPELAERLRRRQGDVKVLFTSGYADRAVVDHGVLEGDVPFISKPFSVLDLSRKVRTVLAGRA